MKKLLLKFRFFFRRKITYKNLNFTEKRRLLFMFENTSRNPKKAIFKRTFNNILCGNGFQFVGLVPLFFDKESFYCYSGFDNLID